jgi:hypothetical protein
MSREGDLMRRAIKRRLQPAIEHLGFVGKLPSMQRKNPDSLDVLGIQYWKYGGEFILEFGRCELGDRHNPWGVVPEAKIQYGHLNPLERARLEQRGPNIGKGFRGFSFQGFGEDIGKYEALVEEVIPLLPQIDAWLEKRGAGSHVHAFSYT